jgi:hypothetical protein
MGKLMFLVLIVLGGYRMCTDVFVSSIPRTCDHQAGMQLVRLQACTCQDRMRSIAQTLSSAGNPFSSLAELCSTYGLQPASSSHHVPKVFDFFLAGPYELDMMEIRLQTLAEVVDAFVPIESRMTLQGQQKRLSVPLLYHQLPGQVLNKIRSLVFDELEGADGWARERCQRQAMLTSGPASN